MGAVYNFDKEFKQDDFEIVDPSKQSQATAQPTKWEKEFELESNRFQVKFNDPNISEGSSSANQQTSEGKIPATALTA